MQQSLRFLVVIVLFGVLVSVGAVYRLQKETPSKPPLSLQITPDISGTFQGDLPCADCSFLRLTLTLNPNGTYILISQYAEKGTFETSGLWKQEKNLISLLPENQQFMVLNNETIELVGKEGQPAASKLNYKLTRQ